MTHPSFRSICYISRVEYVVVSAIQIISNFLLLCTPENERITIRQVELAAMKIPALKFKSSTDPIECEDFLDSVVEKRLSDPAADPFAKDCLLLCKQVYENADDAMKKPIEDVNRGSYYSANVDLSALTTDLETCIDCIKEIYGDDQEFMSFDDWAGKITEDALEKIVGFSS
uniref:Pectinesterase inhibitor-like n=1 Tax=Nicotiana tabacum TaxID=4097 RepID=A0A1S3ZES0_TOBAC|nr:PREDICTED: uncharacterized protein LOC107786054 [Nicotiana tabacum]